MGKNQTAAHFQKKKKLKELLDIGAISQQEFENNKKKLLASS